MKLSKLWSISVLIALAFLLSAESGNSESNTSSATRNQRQGQNDTPEQRTPNSSRFPTATVPPLDSPTVTPEARHPEPQAGDWWQRLRNHLGPPLWQTFFPPVWSNWALVIIAAIAACAAVRSLKEIARQSRIAAYNTRVSIRAANAATKSADAALAAIHADRPHLLIARIEIVEAHPADDVQLPRGAHVILENFGSGPADIVEIKADIDFWPLEPFGPSAAFANAPQNAEVPVVRPNGDTKFFVPAGLYNNAPDIPKLINGELAYGIYGKITYRGLPDTRYETHFFWWYSHPSEHVFRSGNDTLNRRT